MSRLSSSQGTIRFSDFDVDLRSGELRKHGIRIKLQVQPFQVLHILLENPGQVITREELQKRIWPADTFVDFDQGLNNAVKKLREALGDDAEKPRFIETRSKRGYRFIGSVQSGGTAAAPKDLTASATLPEMSAAERHGWGFAIGLVLGGAVLAALVLLVGANFAGIRDHLLGKSIAPRIQSLAVLPLQNLSGDASQQYFADGMTDAVITDLAQIGSLKVISRTSVMRYKKTDKSLPVIARELKVDGIIEGTVQRSGDRVRITAQLIHGASDKHIWARSYDRDWRDVLQLQGEVANDIAKGISSNLGGAVGGHPVSPYPLNLDAYDDYLKGRNYVGRETQHDLIKGIEFLERSIRRDPNYAPTYAELSRAYQGLAGLEHRPPGEMLPKAKAAALKALALDENLAEAHEVLGGILGDFEWDWAGEEREARRALELDPNSSRAHSLYALYLVTFGRKTDGIREMNTALELDPFSPIQRVGASLVFLGARQLGQAVREGRRAIEIDPSYAIGHLVLSGALGAEGKSSEGFVEWLQYLTLDGDAELARELESAMKNVSRLGDPGEKLAHITLSYYQRRSKTQYVASLAFAYAYLELGDRDRTFEWLNKAYQERSTALYFISVDPSFDRLRSDPRFQDLLRRMNLPVDPTSISTSHN